MRTLIGLLLSLSDRRFRYTSGRERDRSIAEPFRLTVLVNQRTQTVIGLLLSFSD